LRDLAIPSHVDLTFEQRLMTNLDKINNLGKYNERFLKDY